MATREAKLQIVVDAVNRAGATFDTLGRNLDAVSKKTADLRAGMTAVGTAGTAAFAVVSVGVGATIKAAAEMENLKLGLVAVAGSAEEAERQFARLLVVAKLPGLGVREVTQASVDLQAAGVSAAEAERSIKAFGNALATVGRGKVDLKDTLYGLRQMHTSGTILAEDLNIIKDRVPQVSKILTEAFGTARSEDLVQMGLSSREVIDAIVSGLEELPPVQQSTSVAFENLQDNLFVLSNAIGTAFLPAVNGIIAAVTPVAEALAAWATEHPHLSAAILGVTLVLTGLMALLLPLAVLLPGLAIMFGALGVAMAAVSLPMLIIVAGITAVTAALLYLISQGYATKEAWQNVWLGIKLVAADAANAVIGIVEGMINFVLEGVNKAIRAINKVISAAQKVPGIGKNLSKIGELKAVDLGGFDTETIAANDLAGRSNPVNWGNQVVNLIGGNYLSETVAEQIGDMIMSKLKLSSPL